MKFVGIDGCRAGWFAVALTGEEVWETRIIPASAPDELKKLGERAERVLIDIPMGLPEPGAYFRVCDREARRFLGAGRTASVFPVPIRAALNAGSYAEACAINFELTGKRLSKQTWNISAKIRQIDLILREHPVLQEKLFECHPEICFQVLNDGKKRVA